MMQLEWNVRHFTRSRVVVSISSSDVTPTKDSNSLKFLDPIDVVHVDVYKALRFDINEKEKHSALDDKPFLLDAEASWLTPESQLHLRY